MRVGVALAGVGALFVSTYFVVVLVSPRPLTSRPTHHDATAEENPPPAITVGGPQPKAVVDQTEFDFGRMEVGEERQHDFTIRNEGKAPLKITMGKPTCQCTVSRVETDELAPGASAKITLTWKPTGQAEKFGKGAPVHTNDPDNEVIQLKIEGMVVPRLVTVPEGNWEAPEIAVDKPTVFTGLVISPVSDSFQILDVACKSPYVTTEVLPIEPELLQTRRGKSGYQIRVSISPELPLGTFNFPLSIKTDLPARSADGTLGKEMEIDVTLGGYRRGPLRVVGRDWDEERMAVLLGSFNASDGKQVTLMLFARGAPDEGLQLTEPAVCSPEELRVTLSPDPKATGKLVRYLLAVEYPAGAPRATFLKDHPASVRLRTNHPAAREIELQVFFNAN
jgi:hypothetical protein